MCPYTPFGDIKRSSNMVNAELNTIAQKVGHVHQYGGI